jgi:hypothetical protein
MRHATTLEARRVVWQVCGMRSVLGDVSRRRVAVAVGVVVVAFAAAWPLSAHDFFLRATAFDVPRDTAVVLTAYNGTFSTSANAVTPDRLTRLDVARRGVVSPLDRAAWVPGTDSLTRVRVETGAPGTLVVGAETAPRVLALDAAAFNGYLADDGIPDELAARRRDGTAGTPSRESYAKGVKAVLRVGGVSGTGFDVVLGHAAELVPVDDPYAVRRGGTLRVRALGQGVPLANHLVLAGGRSPTGARLPVQSVRTDSAGVARIRLTRAGQWYVKFIHMRRAAAGDTLTHLSRWATLTFGVP